MCLEEFWLYLQSQIDKTKTFLNLFAYENENAWLQLNCLLAKMLSLTAHDEDVSKVMIVFTRKIAVTNSVPRPAARRQTIVFTRKNAVTNSP